MVEMRPVLTIHLGLFLILTLSSIFPQNLGHPFSETFQSPERLESNHSRSENELSLDMDVLSKVRVSELDPEEAEESARIEEEELQEEIAQAEQELERIVSAHKELEAEEGQGQGRAQGQLGDGVQDIQEIKTKAVQNLMQIFGLPESLMRSETPGPAPEFMIDLYNTITDSSGVTRAKNPYNAHVVRSFIERDSSLNDFFYFNISSIELSESILEAELHLYRMPTPHHQLHPSLYLTPFYILSLYQVRDPRNLNIPDLHKLLGVHYVPALGSGWEVFNVKKAVMEWLGDEGSENQGFLVAASSLSGDRVPVRFSRRGETIHSKQPILVLFNHDAHMVTKKETDQQVNGGKHHGGKKVRRKKLPGGHPQEDEQPESEFTYETTTPLSSLENPRFHHSLLFQDSIRHPNSVSRFRSRRSKNETEPSETNELGHLRSNLTECGIHDLFVSFESIGWSSWIISPKGYNAHYCDGPCTFPLGKNVKPTNHATVQSIINELNLNPGLSRPCCVPTTLLPISLLYYDDQDNVVLKQYVDMVAGSCGCH